MAARAIGNVYPLTWVNTYLGYVEDNFILLWSKDKKDKKCYGEDNFILLCSQDKKWRIMIFFNVPKIKRRITYSPIHTCDGVCSIFRMSLPI